jgi:transposase
VLLGMEGVTVTGAEEGAGGRLAVWARVSGQAACPRCRTVSERVHEYVTTRPRDVRYGSRGIDLILEKRRLACGNRACPRGTFTEWAPQVPPRCRITRRLLEHCGDEVADRGITPAEAARHNGVSWPSAHGAFAEKADTVLAGEPEPVAHLGIDEHRRGRARWRRDEKTGEYALIADRWHTCFYDLSGIQGPLGRRRARGPRGGARRRLSSRRAGRRGTGPPRSPRPAASAAPRTGRSCTCRSRQSSRRRARQASRRTASTRRHRRSAPQPRRGKAGDPEYGIKYLLERNLENLSPEQFAKVIEPLDPTGPGQHIALAWIGKEKLRRALNLRARVTGSAPCERQVRDRLFSFYDWCAQNEQVTELTTLARTISRWEDEIVTAVLTGVTNARSESLNRIAKLEARHAYGFRNPASQRRRVRTACTRRTRRKSVTTP